MAFLFFHNWTLTSESVFLVLPVFEEFSSQCCVFLQLCVTVRLCLCAHVVLMDHGVDEKVCTLSFLFWIWPKVFEYSNIRSLC